ncbi:MAG: homocysteine S-methyltransferase family protein [Pikeienuella sp.]
MITILDGSIGQEIVTRAPGEPTPLWGLEVMMSAPAIVREIHDDYFAAGADIATTNTYNALRDRLANNGVEDRFEGLHATACELAVAARDAAGRGKVAGSLGPLGASYRPDLVPPASEAAPLYAEIAKLQAPYVDLFICETMSSVEQARGALMGAQTVGKPVWLAISVSDEDGTRLRSGEPVEDILPVVAELKPDALLVNCSLPEAVTAALPLLSGVSCPLGAYANGFTGITDAFKEDNPTVAVLKARTDLGPAEYAAFAQQWVDLGATIIGGCCEVGPAHIAALRDKFSIEGTN